jgi:hypothetical protein
MPDWLLACTMEGLRHWLRSTARCVGCTPEAPPHSQCRQGCIEHGAVVVSALRHAVPPQRQQPCVGHWLRGRCMKTPPMHFLLPACGRNHSVLQILRACPAAAAGAGSDGTPCARLLLMLQTWMSLAAAWGRPTPPRAADPSSPRLDAPWRFPRTPSCYSSMRPEFHPHPPSHPRDTRAARTDHPRAHPPSRVSGHRSSTCMFVVVM